MKKVLCILLAGILIMAAPPALAQGARPIIAVEGGNVTVSLEEGFNEDSIIWLESYGVKEPIEKLTIAEGIKTINIVASFPVGEIYIPSTLESADGLPDFKNCSVAEESPFFTDIDGVLFSKDAKTLVRYGALREDKAYTVPEGTEVIGGRAFPRAKADYVILPEGVKEIGDYAFANCTNLKRADFPIGLEAIGGDAFMGCVSLEEAKLPQSLKSIGSRAFSDCINLKCAALPDGLESLGEGAFMGCVSLEEAKLPQSLKSIGSRVFSDCTNLKRADLPDGLESLGEDAFMGCVSLEEAKLPQSLKSIGSRAFSDCTNLKRAVLPDGLENIGECAFWNCVSLTEARLPKSLKELGGAAFGLCENTKITFDEDNENLVTENGIVFNADKTRLMTALPYFEGVFVLPENIDVVPQSCFAGSSVEEVVMHENTKEIGIQAFNSCSKLKRLEIPKNTEFCYIALDCPNLEEVVLNCDYLRIPSFVNCDIERLVITSDKFGISFEKTEVIMGSSYNIIGAFKDTSIKCVYAPVGSEAEKTAGRIPVFPIEMSDLSERQKTPLAVSGGNIYLNLDTGTVVHSDRYVREVSIPMEVEGIKITAISEKAFYKRKYLTSLKGEGIEKVGAEAFSGCEELKEASFPALKSLGENALFSCGNLRTLEFPTDFSDFKVENGMLVDKSGATLVRLFKGCGKELVLPDNITAIADGALSGNSEIETVETNNVTSIGERAFYGCKNLESIHMPNALIIGDAAFEECGGMKTVELGKIREVGKGAFWGCYKLKDVYYAGNYKERREIAVGDENENFKCVMWHYGK